MFVGAPIVIKANSYSLGAIVQALGRMQCEGINMFLGPTDFPPNIVESMASCYYLFMTEKKEDKMQKPPKGHEIPIPTKGDFLRDLEKASKPGDLNT